MDTLEADSIHLSFGRRNVLSNVHISCATGEVVSIIGRNGSGKSSLLKIIFGSLRGQDQTVRINKEYIRSLYQKPEAVVYLTQENLFMNYLTPEILADIFCAPQILQIDKISDYRKEPIGSLSGGLRKFAEIMTLLYSKSKFILMDEPFSNLSPLLTEIVVTHILRQSKTKGIILTDHQFEIVWSVASKHYILSEGRLRQVHQKAELEQFGYLQTKKQV